MHVWNIRLFGNLAVSRGEDAFSRFSTRKTGSLLAFLAFYPQQHHSREALCELLWPEEPPEKSRARLRVALTSLRHQLEPPDVPPGSVIRTDGHDQVSLASEAVVTDVAEVESALRTVEGDGEIDQRIAAANRIASLLQKPLLTSFYESWVTAERDRLNQIVVERLSDLARQMPPETGLELARHAARIDPLAEEPLLALLPHLAASGQHSAAHRAFQAFRTRSEQELGILPSPELCRLAASLPSGRTKNSLKIATEPQDPPLLPLLSLSWTHRLPSYLTRFFGREDERQELQNALNEARLVTLTGPGGTGKTRLAVEAGRAWEGDSCFVSLAEIGAPNGILAAMWDALGEKTKQVQDSPDALLAGIAEAFANAPNPLLILDNLEQMADSAGSILLALMERVPTLRLLVTSRLRLHLSGERELSLPPLPISPPDPTKATLADVSQTAGVALFLDRARAARPDFQITPRNSEDVLSICQMLEGNPLAMELVAARTGTMVPSQIRENLAGRGSLQFSDRRAAPDARHRSLHAAIDWSFQLLSPDLRHFFTHLSVFRGGFTIEAAAVVCECRGENLSGETIARLRSHSLVGSVADTSQMRFTLLESLRAFAAEQFTEKEAESARERHADWFADMAERFDTAMSGPEQAFWLERVEADVENFRAAMEHHLSKKGMRAVQMAGALWTYWNLRGKSTEGRLWLDRALAAHSIPDSRMDSDTRVSFLFQRSRALHGAGTLALQQSESIAAQPLFEECLRLRQESGNPAAIASALNNLGLLAMSRREWDTARRFLGESISLRRTLFPVTDVASSLMNLGGVEWECGDLAAAGLLYQEALTYYQEVGERIGEGKVLNNLGNIALCQENFAEAERWYEKSLISKRALGNTAGVATTLGNIGVAALYQGGYEAAAAYFEEALVIYREMNSLSGISDMLRNLGQIATCHGEWDRAFSLLTESLAVTRSSDALEDIVGNLEGFALFASAKGEAEKAAHLLGAADALRLATDSPVYPPERVALDKAADAARKAIGDKAFAEAFRKGALLSPSDTVQITQTLTP